MNKLPIGIQTFREICGEGYGYVDKTPLIAQLTNEGKYYFHRLITKATGLRWCTATSPPWD